MKHARNTYIPQYDAKQLEQTTKQIPFFKWSRFPYQAQIGKAKNINVLFISRSYSVENLSSRNTKRDYNAETKISNFAPLNSESVRSYFVYEHYIKNENSRSLTR